jgi:hypothetical protein
MGKAQAASGSRQRGHNQTPLGIRVRAGVRQYICQPEEHMAGSEGFVADLASLVHITSRKRGVLPEVNVGIVSRGTVLNVLLDGLFVPAF